MESKSLLTERKQQRLSKLQRAATQLRLKIKGRGNAFYQLFYNMVKKVKSMMSHKGLISRK